MTSWKGLRSTSNLSNNHLQPARLDEHVWALDHLLSCSEVSSSLYASLFALEASASSSFPKYATPAAAYCSTNEEQSSHLAAAVVLINLIRR